MSNCMYCWLARRVAYSAVLEGRAGGGGGSSQARDGVHRLLWIILDLPQHSSSFTTKRYSTRACLPMVPVSHGHHQPRRSHSATAALHRAVASVGACASGSHVKHQTLTMNPKDKDDAGTMNFKRTRDVLSPLRPQSQKKVRGGRQSPWRSSVKSRALELDFIPLPPSPPPQKLNLSDIPLPPSPSESSFADFFIIDTTPSEVVFPEPDVGKKDKSKRTGSRSVRTAAAESQSDSGKINSSGDVNNRKLVISGVKNNITKTVPNDDDILVIASTSENETNKPLNQQSHNRDSGKSRNKSHGKKSDKKRESVTNDEDIDVVFEGPSVGKTDEVMVMCTVPAHGRTQKGLLSPGRSVTHSTTNRRCHSSARPGLKTKPREEQADEQPEDEIIPLHSEDMETQKGPDRSQRETSPDIQKVDVIDPDVVEIEDSLASCGSSPCNVEVVELYDSGNEDAHSTQSSSDYEAIDMDISTNDFITVSSLSEKVKEVTNKEIDLSDETLDRRKEYERLRKWDMTGLGQDVLAGRNSKPSDTMFTVLSYNVLAQALLRDNMRLYTDCCEEHLSWAYRWALLQHEITQIDPDVLMCQEVEAAHYHSHYLPWLTFLGYEGLFKKRTGLKADGCAIFFKKNKFSLIEHTSIEYLQPQASQVLDRDNIGLIAKLASVSQPNAPPVCVATTHLLYNPRRHDVKLAQIVLLLSEIDRLSFLGEKGGRSTYCPVLVSGDFNAEPHSTVIQFMKSGRLHYEGLARKTLTRHGSFDTLLGPELVPSALGLTDRCQHSVLAQSRFLEQARGPIFSLQDKRNLEESLIHLHHSDRTDSRQNSQRPSNSGSHGGPTPSGWISHGFNFNSVYQHRAKHKGGGAEATTKHNGWTSVDYIFYSRQYSDSHARPVEGNLKLLARYRLLSGPEAEMYGPLPSAVCPSDHFPLAAQFLLRR